MSRDYNQQLLTHLELLLLIVLSLQILHLLHPQLPLQQFHKRLRSVLQRVETQAQQLVTQQTLQADLPLQGLQLQLLLEEQQVLEALLLQFLVLLTTLPTLLQLQLQMLMEHLYQVPLPTL